MRKIKRKKHKLKRKEVLEDDNKPIPGTNFKNRTVCEGENLDFLQRVSSNSVTLAYLDPPFNKNADFESSPDKVSAGARFKDRWRWKEDVHREWVILIKKKYPVLYQWLFFVRDVLKDPGGAAYCCYMAVRLLEVHRILNDKGSLYLHCDSTASHYLRQLLGIIFGEENYCNTISWCYAASGNPPKHFLGRKHDTILFFAKNKGENVYNREYLPITEATKRSFSKWDPERGDYYKTHGKHRLYLKENKGTALPDYWVDIHSFGTKTQSKEYMGYPTQKPLALIRRIINLSSNKGDVVMDCFVGMHSTTLAAEGLGRKWIVMDQWEGSKKIMRKRLGDNALVDDPNIPNGFLFNNKIHIITKPKKLGKVSTSGPYLKSVEKNEAIVVPSNGIFD